MDNKLLRGLPSVDELLRSDRLNRAPSLYSAALLTDACRQVLRIARSEIISGIRAGVSEDELAELVLEKAKEMLKPGIVRVINASGAILHTNIGRALLSKEAVDAVRLASEANINIEFDLKTGERGERDSHVEGLIKKLTGAEAACVVNNNAAAVLITLNTLAEGSEVIISRGELIEIGGSFRLPEIIKKSGCILKEVGTTNRTRPNDYTSAVSNNTALLFKAHASNFRVVGFTSEVGLKELSGIGRKSGLPVVEDLGSGSLIDLSIYGLPKEPVVGERISAGADVVTFSGDKLLGGPQAGIIAGKKEIIDRIKNNPLKRALRADKLTVAALEATLRLYLNLDSLPERLPALKFLVRPLKAIEETAERACAILKKCLGAEFEINIEDGESVVGGGSLPGHNLPTKVITIAHKTEGPEGIFRAFLNNTPPILGRIKKDKFTLDLRTVEDPSDVVPEKVFNHVIVQGLQEFRSVDF